MALRPITTTAEIKPWLPSDYLTSTGFTDAIIQTLLDEGADPRLIAAEVWEEYAGSLPVDSDGGERLVKSWQNIDVSVQYDTALSPRDVALRQARFHRSRAKVRSVRLSRPLIEGEPPQEA